MAPSDLSRASVFHVRMYTPPPDQVNRAQCCFVRREIAK